MEKEPLDMENVSDLDNLLSLAEEEFFSNDKKDSDCEILGVSINSPPNIISSIRSITTTLSVAKSRVQSSIAQFFKPPKRIPDEEEILTEMDVSLKRFKTTTAPIVYTKSKDFKYTIPKFKLIPGTPFAVDAFSYGPIKGVTGYFLTHFHSDHYKGLSNKLFPADSTGSRLYCSEVTGNLVQKELKIRKEVIITLKIGQIYQIEGIHVGILDANQ